MFCGNGDEAAGAGQVGARKEGTGTGWDISRTQSSSRGRLGG